MSWGFDDIWNGLKSIPGQLQGAWNDYTGVTAAQMSAKASEENTKKQLAWERERATSAHQWEVEDLKKAGLNPVLSAGGSGAVTGGITPQMPDYSQYKGWGAIVPLISSMYDNILKTSNSAKAKADADLSYERQFTEKTNQILNLYNSGLVSAKTAGQLVENEIQKTNLKWLPWEKGVGIAKDVVNSVMPVYLSGKIIRNAGNTASQISNNVIKLNKNINKLNNPWKKMGDGKKVNIFTGEIKNTRVGKTYHFNGKKINESLKK